MGAEGFSGAMIYSQNCYDGLAHSFTWAKLDTCGAFDMLAVRSIADAATTSLVNEAGYFQSEAAAGRYISAATAAGAPADGADTRLSALQTRVGQASLVGRRSPSASATASNQVAASEEAVPTQRDEFARCVRGAMGRLPSNADRTTLCTCVREKVSVDHLAEGEAISQCAIEVEAEFPAR
jgi:hypothetical protein